MISCTPWIEHLVLHLPIALEGVDPEGVHQVRVAAGRLSTWLVLADRRALRDDLRWLRRNLGPVRDLDVMLEAHAGAEWARLLEGERGERHRELAATLRSPRVIGLISALRVLPPLEEEEARARLDRMRRRVVRAGARLEGGEQDLADLHRLRRKLRRLRYAHEWLGEKNAGLVELQDALGALNNLAVAARYLERFSGTPEFVAAREEIRRAVEAQRAVAVTAWERARHSFASAA